MRKRLIFITVICTCAILAGCNNSKASNNTITSSAENNTTSTNNSTKNISDNVTANTVENKVNNTASNTTASRNAVQSNVSSGGSIAKSQEEIYLGQWIIDKVIGHSSAGTYSEDDIKSLIGKKLTFSTDKATCFGDDKNDINNTIEKPFYEKSTVPEAQFSDKWKNTISSALGINASSATEVDVTDSKNNTGCIFYIKDDNTLIIYGGGNFFEATRAN